LHSRISASERFVAPFAPQLDIVVWAVRSTDLATSSRLAQEIFERAAERDLHLALVELPVKFFPSATFSQATADRITCLRSVLMKPEHNLWINSVWKRLLDASNIC
jgi:hypothetical protein